MSSPLPTPNPKFPESKNEKRFEHIGSVDYEYYEAYRPAGLHPVHLGDVFKDRYKVINKLGFGSFSTVWLALNQKSRRVVALKVLVAKKSKDPQELKVLQALGCDSPTGLKSPHVVDFLDHFDHEGPNGTHKCLVFEAMGPSISRMLREFAPRTSYDGIFPLWVAKRILKQILMGIAQLHKAGVVHTDLQAGNVLFVEPKPEMTGVGDAANLTSDNHVLLKRIDGKVDRWAPQYMVKSIGIVKDYKVPTNFQVKLSDFGGSFLNSEPPDVVVTPLDLRAPEMLLNLPLNQALDIWSFGCMLFSMLTGENLFSIFGLHSTEEEIIDDHMTQMIDTLGPLPKDLQSKWGNYSQNYTEDGELLQAEYKHPTLEECLQKLKAVNDHSFLDEHAWTLNYKEIQQVTTLIRRMLRYDATQRSTAAELLQDIWFTSINTV